jgi:hypothetical protein
MRHPVAAIARPTYLRFLCPIEITACRILLFLGPLHPSTIAGQDISFQQWSAGVHCNSQASPRSARGHKRPFASVGPHASFTFTNRHSPGQSSRRTRADGVDVGSLSVFENSGMVGSRALNSRQHEPNSRNLKIFLAKNQKNCFLGLKFFFGQISNFFGEIQQARGPDRSMPTKRRSGGRWSQYFFEPSENRSDIGEPSLPSDPSARLF